MRAACALAVFHGVLLSAVCCGAEQFPYKAYLNANDVYVRSGPGKNYYPTDKLRRGAEVEVYRHDPGGWYAIRPPADSYSWISGGQLNILEDNLAEVAQPDVIAYVGSKFSDVHDVRQVKLEAGELVQIVGEKRFVTPDNGKAETWYKIEPPRGEFRWVFGRFVVPQGIAGTTAEHVDSDERPPAANRWSKSQGERGERGETSLARATHSEPAAAERQIPDQADPESVAIPAAAYQGSEQNIALTADSTAADVAPHNGLLYSTTRPATRRMSQIEKLDGELSLMVAEPPARWDFHSLRMRVQAAVDNAASALERGRAKDLLNDMGRYEQLQAGYAEIDAIRSQTDHQNQMVNVAATAAKPPRQPQTPAIVNPPGNTVAANIPLGNTPLGNIPPGNIPLGNIAPV
ncbi:MAG: SH3 domain-containing protein, partial [Planctomycetales bacterium]|nr:SH3 domain-containing protein [Planctomycetales bacterium]NIM07992.1 SH3 domain-containing protein [Planctomycetales bacterium]NIN07470.1 SH3 domain-containing protein [Planctomycetales bacterium]NIN76577.1 SH3 domain-containing protein [Planctomycetales bacterium]NIO33764.1 SH3 domain-containing protein [Planctomycetales bacterium]